MQYEGDTLERDAGVPGGWARSSGNVNSVGWRARAAQRLNGLYGGGELPAAEGEQPFRHLQERISALETAIADRREVYNDAVNTNNVRIDAFPDAFVARLGDFPPAQLLHVQPEQKSDVDLKAAFSR
jgi:LemA protein